LGATLLGGALLPMLSGCDAPPPEGDGGLSDGGLDALVPSAPARPVPPEAPSFTCAAGFTGTLLPGDASVCEPWPAGRPRCAQGERLAAGIGCVALADDCTLDAPSEIDMGASFVREGSLEGDGSRDRPFGTLTEAVASGALLIALAPGTYDVPATLTGQTLAGTCPTATLLRLTSSTRLTNVTLRRLGVTGPGTLIAASGGRTSLERVDVAALGGGIRVEGAFEARETAIRDLSLDAIRTTRASAVLLEDVSIERIRGVAMRVDDAAPSRTEVTIRRVVIDELRTSAASAAAILLDHAGALVVEGLVIEDGDVHGLLAIADAASVQDVVIRRMAGAGLFLETGSGDRMQVLSSIWIAETAAGVTLGRGRYAVNDLVVERAAGTAVSVVYGSAELARVLIDGATAVGLDLDLREGTVALRDLHVRNVVHVEPRDGGAVLVESGAVQLERAWLERVEHHGIAVVAGATLEADDLAVDDVRATLAQTGFGVLVLDGAEVTLHRASIENVVTAGLMTQDATVRATDLTVSHVTTGEGPDGIGVVAVTSTEGAVAAVTLERAEVLDVQRWGVIASGSGASLMASDLVVRAVHVAPCCELGRGGSGIVVHDGAHANIARFLVAESEHAGVVATAGVSASFEAGRVERNAVGLVRSPGLPYNLGLAPGLTFSGVILLDNVLDQQLTETEVRAPSLAL
jgi:hypothetical protein